MMIFNTVNHYDENGGIELMIIDKYKFSADVGTDFKASRGLNEKWLQQRFSLCKSIIVSNELIFTESFIFL